MPGQNLFGSAITKSLTGRPCVFISHRRDDLPAAKATAAFLQSVNIDIYLDDNDYTLAQATRAKDFKRVVNCIEVGIDSSSHLLGILSPKTKESWWVPFEIGSARQKGLHVAYMLLDNIDLLPEYLLIMKQIHDNSELKSWVVTEFGQQNLVFGKSINSFPLRIPGLPESRGNRVTLTQLN